MALQRSGVRSPSAPPSPKYRHLAMTLLDTGRKQALEGQPRRAFSAAMAGGRAKGR